MSTGRRYAAICRETRPEVAGPHAKWGPETTPPSRKIVMLYGGFGAPLARLMCDAACIRAPLCGRKVLPASALHYG